MTAHAGWGSVVQRALLGTERAVSAASAFAPEVATLLDQLDANDAERVLLATAAVASTYESAGRLPRRALTPVIDAAPLDDLPEAPPRIARFLTTMLGGVNDEVLREWFAAVAARGWRVPAYQLPALLDLGTTATFFRATIVPVLGMRGKWLAAQNADWAWASAPLSIDESALRAAWETGTPDERGAILSATRERDAALGRSLLESTWDSELPSHRASLLGLLLINLSLDDEPFIESALDDRRQEVRRVAAELLRRLAGSQLVARMTARARSALQWMPGKLLKRAQVAVEPPATLDDALARDGIEKKPPQGTGERAWWLAQILSAVPPQTWTAEWSATAEDLIAAASASDWERSLLEGWAAAAVRHRDGAFAEALLATGFPGDKPTSIAPAIPALMGVMAADRREAFVTTEIKKRPNVDATVAFVAAADHSWSESFTRTALEWLRVKLSAATGGGAAEWQLREVVPRLALRVPPKTAVAENWALGEDAGGFAKAVDRFMSILSFRRELAEELDR